MRFSTTIIAAGLTATTVFGVPLAERDESSHGCDWKPTSTGKISPTSTAFNSTSSTATPTSVSSSTVPTTNSSSTTSASGPVSTSKGSGKFTFFGVNESGAEFGDDKPLPGTLGTEYAWPNTASISTLMEKGMNTFRIPFLLERMTTGTLGGNLDATYLSDLKKIVSFITEKGGYAVIDAHNYGRYHTKVITSTTDFKGFWGSLAKEFATNEKAVFDCNNEFHDMGSPTLVPELNQACIDGIRGAGAIKQYIFVEGTAYTGAWTWVSNNGETMLNLKDPSDKIVYEMHQYLDIDASGKYDTCVSSTIGAERIEGATAWLKANGKKGILGEFAGGANPQCQTAITGMLDAMSASGVWMGGMWWGGGAMWGEYIYSMEPPKGTGYAAYIDTLAKYAA